MNRDNNDIALSYRAYLDGLGCSFRSMEEYDRMLRLSFNTYLSEYPNYSNFYDCTDSSLVAKIFDRMNADPYFKELNKKWRGVPENAFRHYISFLHVVTNIKWQNNSTIVFYKFLTEDKNLSVTNAGKIIDILKNRTEVKSVLKSNHLYESGPIMDIIMKIVNEIINSYSDDNRAIAVRGCRYLLEFGKESLPVVNNIHEQPAKK